MTPPVRELREQGMHRLIPSRYSESGTVLEEVAGDAATFVPAGDVGAWASAIDALLLDDGRREAQVEQGRRRARRFSEASAMAATFAVYLEALRQPRRT